MEMVALEVWIEEKFSGLRPVYCNNFKAGPGLIVTRYTVVPQHSLLQIIHSVTKKHL